MAKKTKENLADQESDPESDTENEKRDDERGRTVLNLVGKAIQSNNKIPLEWNARRVPCGEYKTVFSTYIGVVVRERVCINYKKWTEIPKALLDEVYRCITIGFIVREDRRKWILSRASKRWNAFKTRLRKYWLYKSEAKIRKKAPWKYPWIHQTTWDKFTSTYTSPEFKEMSAKFRERSLLKNSSYRGGRLGYQYYEEELEKELLNQGIHVTEVPRHLVWLKAHSFVNDDGRVTFKNPADLEVGEAIKTLMRQTEDGGIRSKGRDDILARAMNKPERGGRVVAVGSGITHKEYFGYNKPIPPTQLHARINSLVTELVAVKNQQNLLASFVMSTLNDEQLRRFAAFNNGSQSTCFIGQVDTQATGFHGKLSTYGEIGSNQLPSSTFEANVSGQINDSAHVNGSGQISGFGQLDSSGAQDDTLFDKGISFTQLLTQDFELCQVSKDVRADHVENEDRMIMQQTEQYRVPWRQSEPELEPEPLHQYSTSFVQRPSLENIGIFPEGESDCSLAVETNEGLQIVAIGTVFIEAGKQTTVHFNNLEPGFRRVSVLQVLVPDALLPCPTEEWTVVVQAKHSFVKWPNNLILSRSMVATKKNNQQTRENLATKSPRPSSSQGSCSRKYVITAKDRLKLTTDLVRVLKNEGMAMKKNNEKIIVPIASNVTSLSQDVELNYEDLLDWCFQKEIGASHISIFMKYLCEKCQKESVLGIYGFCDVNYLSPLSPIDKEDRIDYLARVFGCNDGLNTNQTFFAPFYDHRHWMLAVVSPWNGMVWWLDPAGAENETPKFAEEIINGGIIKFSLHHRKDIKKIKKNPLIKWRKPVCPRQPLDSLDCGFYVCRYMLEMIANRQQVIPDQYFKDIPKTYSQQMIDELREMWITFVLKHKEVEDEEDDDLEAL